MASTVPPELGKESDGMFWIDVEEERLKKDHFCNLAIYKRSEAQAKTLYFACLVRVKIDRQIQVDKRT